jgi:hypothetical protein
MNNDERAKRIAEAVIEAAAKLCAVEEQHVREFNEPMAVAACGTLHTKIRSLDLDAIIASVPYCERQEGCVCGGDTPAVQATCGYWVKGKP